MEKIAAEKESPIFVPSVTTRFCAFRQSSRLHGVPVDAQPCLPEARDGLPHSRTKSRKTVLETVVKNMGAFHIAGANVTMPFKTLSKYLDALAKSARHH